MGGGGRAGGLISLRYLIWGLFLLREGYVDIQRGFRFLGDLPLLSTADDDASWRERICRVAGAFRCEYTKSTE